MPPGAAAVGDDAEGEEPDEHAPATKARDDATAQTNALNPVRNMARTRLAAGLGELPCGDGQARPFRVLRRRA
jgi:hypothetical protein